jgi:hypothetical protein
MNRWKYAFIICLFLGYFQWLNSTAQTATVTGKVVDGVTNEPLPFTNVYFDKTSIGTASDEAGRFTIRNASVDFSELVASAIGYKTISAILKLEKDKTTVVEFKMIPDQGMLEEIVVRDKRNKEYEKLFLEFNRYFLGETGNSQQAKIVNPESLDLTYNADEQLLNARTLAPLKVENKALGYTITVDIDAFVASPSFYQLKFRSRFEKLVPIDKRQEKQWARKRLDTYLGSQRHLFRSIMHGKFETEGFKIQKANPEIHTNPDYFRMNPLWRMDETKVVSRDEIIVDTSRESLKALKKGMYEIQYTRKVIDKAERIYSNLPYLISWIEVSDDYLNLHPYGEVKLPANFWRLGHFEKTRIADQLPIDYDPIEEQAKFLISENNELATLRGTIRDEAGSPLANSLVFLDQGLAIAKTNSWGQYELSNLSPGAYPFVFTYDGKQTVSEVVSLSAGETVTLDMQLSPRPKLSMSRKSVTKELQLIFESRLLENKTVVSQQFKLENPEAIKYYNIENKSVFLADEPLKVSNGELGFRWTVYMNQASLEGSSKKSLFKFDGRYRVDTLTASNEAERTRWISKRRDLFGGTWNQFSSSIISSETAADGIKIYQHRTRSNIREPFEIAKKNSLRLLSPDSLLSIKDGKVWLLNPKGTEIHFTRIKSKERNFYKKYNRTIIRVVSDSGRIQISPSGVFDPKSLHQEGPRSYILKRLPIDYQPRMSGSPSDEIQMYINKSNVALSRNSLEKVYIQTDKPYYYPGDTIWMKGYLRYSTQEAKNELSKVLYIDFLDGKGKLLYTRIVPIENGQAVSDFLLASDLPKDNYTLRAYTRYTQNFDDFFLRSIPVLSFDEVIATTDERSKFMDDSIHVDYFFNKSVYKIADTIKLQLQIKDDSQPTKAWISVSVTDQSSVGSIDDVQTIEYLRKPFKAEELSFFRLKYKPERELNFPLFIPTGRDNDLYSVTTLLNQGLKSSVTQIMGKRGILYFNFTDTTSVIIKCTTPGGDYVGVELPERDEVFSTLAKPLTYRLVKNDSRQVKSIALDARLLSEVIVKSKRISAVRKPTLTENRFGITDILREGRLLNPVRQTGKLNEYLLSFVPMYANTYRAIRESESGISNSSSFGRLYSIFYNGSPLPYSDVSNIDAFSISRVEVFNSLFVYVVAVYTAPFYPHVVREFDVFKIRGFSKPSKFSAKQDMIDGFRSTVYWNPSVEAGQLGIANIEFPTSLVSGSYKIVIEGMTERGKLFRIVDYIKVE